MDRKYLVFSLLLLVISAAAAANGEVVIDDFEDGDVSDWEVLWEAGDEFTVELSSLSHSGDYSLLLSDNKVGDTVHLAKQSMDLALNHPISYYNLSLWYYAEAGCSYPGSSFNHRIYLSEEEAFAFSALIIDSGDSMSCGEWNHINLNLDDSSLEIIGLFTLGSESIGSMMIENWNNDVYYDDIKLIPKISTAGCSPEWDCGEWGGCGDGVRNRTCVDLNSCVNPEEPVLEENCTVTLSIVEPDNSFSTPGQVITLSVNATYPDGTAASGLNLSVLAFNVSIPLEERVEGVYSVMVIPEDSDRGDWIIEFEGNADLQFEEFTLYVVGSSVQNGIDIGSIFSNLLSPITWTLTNFWYVIPLGIMLVLVAFKWNTIKRLFSGVRKPKRRKDPVRIKEKGIKLGGTMKDDEMKDLDIDLTSVLRQLTVLEREFNMIEEEITNLRNDVKSGHISDKAAEKIEGKFLAERESIRSAMEKVLEESIEKSNELRTRLEKRLKGIK